MAELQMAELGMVAQGMAADSQASKQESDASGEVQDFIRSIVAEDTRTGRYGGKVVTRFPPEPNGYLHIGHAKSIALNFGVAQEFGGYCNLRFDDTNPETEDMEYVNSIQRDVHWLGFDWKHLRYASDYYQQLYDWAEQLVLEGKAYVDDLNEQEIREYRGTVTEAGRESPYRSRTVEENIDLLRRMRAGEFPDGAKVLRAKGDMASANMKMRDPLLYRIRHESHFRTGDKWCIYPMYDYAHPLSDLIEGVTHSICTLEFENNRDIYDWTLDALVEEPRPHQYEFARLNIDYTVMSKRKLLQLVNEGHVSGWDDPRMPTLAGFRRRGVTPSAIRTFCERIGVAKSNSRVELSFFEACMRDDLNPTAPRVLAVLRPLKVVIENYPEGEVEWLDAPYYPADVPGDPARAGGRQLPFAREIYIEQSDFLENPPAGFFRLSVGREVRLRHAYIITCTGVVKNEAGEVVELRATYDPATKSGAPVYNADGSRRKTQTAIQWVSAQHALSAEVRIYDRLLKYGDPEGEGIPFLEAINPNALEVVKGARIEPSVANEPGESRYQFERTGYFWRDPVESREDALIFNRIVGLRDSWEKVAAKPIEAANPKKSAEKRSGGAAENGAAANGTVEGKPRIAERSAELMAAWKRFVEVYALPDDTAEVLTRDDSTAEFFAAAAAHSGNARGVAKWVIDATYGDLREATAGALHYTPLAVAELVALVDEGAINDKMARDVLLNSITSGDSPRHVVETLGIKQLGDADSLQPLIAKVIAANPDKVAQYRGGKTGLLGFFTGQVMREAGGAANAQVVQELLQKRLED